jgi:hypothetical protein
MVPENKQKRRYKLTTSAFKMIPILYNTMLATPKIKFYSGAFANFGGLTNPTTTIFMGPNSSCTLREFLLLGSLPNSNFTHGSFAQFGAYWALWGLGAQNQMILWGICPFVEAPKLKFYSGGFCPFWGPTGAFWGSGVSKISANGTRKQTQY